MTRMPFRGRPSALFRGVLALLLVCAQLLGAMHAIGHFEAAERPLRVDAQAAPASGGQPATERHERCLLWNDPTVGVDWPLARIDGAPQLSAKDVAGKGLADCEVFA